MKTYLDLVRKVIEEGETYDDRTGVGTIATFGEMVKYDLRDGFPLLTTKKVKFKWILQELLWFISGDCTSTKTLPNPIWDPWKMDEEGSLGPIYGYQWRHWGQDQLKTLVEGIKSNPWGRRHIVSAWNADDLSKMALPPCHVMFQIHVTAKGEMDLLLYQRSADLAIGVPYNVASYSALLMLIAKTCGYTPRYMVHSIGNAHVYKNHLKGLKKQLSRSPKKRPQLTIAEGVDVFSATQQDFTLVGYDPQPFIKFEVAV